MFWLRLIYSRLYGLLRKDRIEQEMDDEMRFHLLMRTRQNIERGMAPDEAEREARRRFGNVGRIKDLARDINGGGLMDRKNSNIEQSKLHRDWRCETGLRGHFEPVTRRILDSNDDASSGQAKCAAGIDSP
jgi:hypothetical protein